MAGKIKRLYKVTYTQVARPQGGFGGTMSHSVHGLEAYVVATSLIEATRTFKEEAPSTHEPTSIEHITMKRSTPSVYISRDMGRV